MPVTTIPHLSASNTESESPSTPSPVFFWQPNRSNGDLSQWSCSPFTLPNGEAYTTAEMWMMVQKARLFGDEAVAKKMLATSDPKRHRALGREVRGFNERVWDAQKLDIVTQGNYHKFTVSRDAQELKNMLLATGERELVEASPYDRIWGIGFAERDAEGSRHWWGQNLLGKALMEVRRRLREEST